MSAKSKKRLCKLQNKLLKLEKLQLEDVICSICQSILIEPVSLPCFHYFCQRCFNGSIENNALCCPLCRLRIGSWLRTATKQNNLVNVQLWKFMQSKFSQEIETKLKGDDIEVLEEIPTPRLSAPGEIRSEYEAELQRLKTEQLQLEQKHSQETQLLIKKIQQEEHNAHKEYLERLRQDELLAKKIQNEESKPPLKAGQKRRRSLRETVVRPKLKTNKIDGYLAKIQAPVPAPIESPLLTDDNTSTGGFTPKSLSTCGNATPKTLKVGSLTPKSDVTSLVSSTSESTEECSKAAHTANTNSRLSPEIVPRNGKLIKHLVDKKFKGYFTTTFWNKENGEKDIKERKEEHMPPSFDKELATSKNDIKEKKKAVIKSLRVSLPLPNSGVLHQKTNMPGRKHTDNDSVDSMRQELCFFKPIEKTIPTSLKSSRKLPVRVPGIRAVPAACEPPPPPPPSPPTPTPSRAQYLDSLCRLRNLSLAKNLPSAFVIALNCLKDIKSSSTHCSINTRQGTKRNNKNEVLTMPAKKANCNKKAPVLRVPNNSRVNSKTNLRRTRSMGSIVKDENETTPKKIRTEERRAISDRKPYLRSASKKVNNSTKNVLYSPPLITKAINSKVNIAVKNLSSPLKNCDVKQILQEQLRIEKMIEQEKKDLEFARQMDAEWNGRRQLRRAPAKRQLTLNYALRPAKKVKVSMYLP